MTQKVHLEFSSSIAHIRMDDSKANTMEPLWLREFDDAMTEAERSAHGLVISGRDGCFSGGLDLKKLPVLTDAELRTFLVAYQRSMVRLFVSKLPTVAAVTGHAIAGGTILALACDERLMADGDFHIGLKEVALGIPLPTFGCELARSVLPNESLRGATQYGETYLPSQARAKGIIDSVLPRDEVVARAFDRARALAELPRTAYGITKGMLHQPFVDRMDAAESRDIELLLGVLRPST